MEHRGPPRQRLGDPAHEGRLLRAGEEPLPAARGPEIDLRTDVAEQLGGVLDLVQDRGGPQLLDEETRVGPHPRQRVGVLEEAIVGTGKEPADERRLAGTPRPGDDQRRERARGAQDLGGEQAWDVPRLRISKCHFKNLNQRVVTGYLAFSFSRRRGA